MGRGCKARNPGGERVQGAGCWPGDAYAWAHLGPEVSSRAGRMPGSRSPSGTSWGGPVPGSGVPRLVPAGLLWPSSATPKPRGSDGSCLAQESGVLATRHVPSPCGLTRNPISYKLSLDCLVAGSEHSSNHYL